MINNRQIKETVALLKQIIEIRATTLTETHPDRLHSQHELARAYEANGQVEEAVALLYSCWFHLPSSQLVYLPSILLPKGE